MEIFLWCAGALWVLLGAGWLSIAKSAFHEIGACLCFSFGVSFWAWAAILGRLRVWHREWRAAQRPASAAPSGAGTPIDQAIHGVRAGGAMMWEDGR